MKKDKIRIQLKQKYVFLKHILLVDFCYEYSVLIKRLGKITSNFFEDFLKNYANLKVGIGGGSTLYNFVDSFGHKSRNIKIYPTAIIGRGPEINHVDSSFLATLLYLKSRPQAKGFVINIPPLPSNKESAIDFLNNHILRIDEVKWLINAIKTLDIAFVGLGALIPTGDFDDEMIKLGITLKMLEENGVIGGINYNWFTKDGIQYGTFFPTLSVYDLKELSKKGHVVLVAGGMHKVEAIKIALLNRMVNCLATDTLTAQSLIE